MSKIRNMKILFNLSKDYLIFKNVYQIRNIKRASVDQYFEFKSQEKNKQFDKMHQMNVDPKSQSVLRQYESKVKEVKNQNQKSRQLINQQYDKTIKSMEFYPDEQIQQIHFDKVDQLQKIQEKTDEQINSISQKYKPKFISERKKYELDYIKKYMLENVKQIEDPLPISKELDQLFSEAKQGYIPNQLVIKKLAFRTKDGKQKELLLIGTEENDEEHCVYIKKLIEKLKIKNVITLLSPDMPYLIKSQDSFLRQWSNFLYKPSYNTKFYLNPNPTKLSDIRMTRQFIPSLLSSMTKSKTFYSTNYSLMQLNQSTLKYQHNPLYSGLINYHVQNIYFGDYPFLKEREMIALNVKLSDLRQLMKQFTQYKVLKKEHFSAELLLPKHVVQKKFNHIIKLAKTVSLINEHPPLLLCNADIAEILAQQWKQSTSEFLEYDYSQHEYFLDLNLSTKPSDQKQVLFIEFIQKLVILDIILSPLIQKFFIKYKSFPYSCKNVIGGKQNLSKAFMVWNHYYKLYKNASEGKFTEKVKQYQDY